MTEKERKEKVFIHELAWEINNMITDNNGYCDFLRDKIEIEKDERSKTKLNEILDRVTKHNNILKVISDKYFKDSVLIDNQ